MVPTGLARALVAVSVALSHPVSVATWNLTHPAGSFAPSDGTPGAARPGGRGCPGNAPALGTDSFRKNRGSTAPLRRGLSFSFPMGWARPTQGCVPTSPTCSSRAPCGTAALRMFNTPRWNQVPE